MAEVGDAIPKDGGKSENNKRKGEFVSSNLITKKPLKEFENITYEEDIKNTEFFVLLDLQLENTQENIKKRINDFKIFEILNKLELTEGLVRIKRIGFRRTKIRYEKAHQANSVIHKASTLLEKYNLKAFIPLNFVTKFGIIKDVPKHFDEQQIKDNIISEIEIRSVTRLTRYNPNDELNRIKTNTIKIGFKGNEIPETIILFLSVAKVSYYIPKPKQCHNCGRLGHLKSQCKSTKVRCLKCGKAGNTCTPPCNIKDQICILCGKNDHNCLDDNKTCWKKQEHDDLNKIMTIKNLSFSEVQQSTFLSTQNQFQLLSDKDYDENFPEINKKNPKTKNNQNEVNKIVRKHQKYNKITFPKQYSIQEPTKFIQGDPFNIESQSIFSVPFDKVTEIEKIINQLLSGLQKTAEENNNVEIINNIKKLKQSVNQVSLQCDETLLKTQSTSTQST